MLGEIMAEQGSKSVRKSRNRAFQAALKDRKKLRRQRAEIHAAIEQAENMRLEKKKGKTHLDKFMLDLGFKRIGNSGDVIQKFVKLSWNVILHIKIMFEWMDYESMLGNVWVTQIELLLKITQARRASGLKRPMLRSELSGQLKHRGLRLHHECNCYNLWK
jgi:hypothetical protein